MRSKRRSLPTSSRTICVGGLTVSCFWQGKRAAVSLKFEPSEKPWAQDVPWPRIGAAVVALVLIVAGFLLRHKLFGPTTEPASTGPAISLAIMPFHNASGDPSLPHDETGPQRAPSTDEADLRTLIIGPGVSVSGVITVSRFLAQLRF